MAEMRRQDRKLTDDEARKILSDGEYGIISLCTTDNRGYGVPVNYVFRNDSVYFHCATEGTKLSCLAANGAVSFCVVGKTKLLPESFGTLYESAIVSGRASELFDAEKREALSWLIEKYSSDYLEEGAKYIDAMLSKARVFRISADSISGKGRRK